MTHRNLLLAVASLALALPGVRAQDKPPVTAPAWDVISIKPNKSGDGRVRFMYSPDGFHALNVTVKMLAGDAYDVRRDLISGAPGWVDSARFDVDAKVAGDDVPKMKDLTQEQRHAMLVSLLVERFHWKAHLETKQLPIYELVIAKGGSKLKQATPGDTYANGIKGPDGKGAAGMFRMSRTQLTAQGTELAMVADRLSEVVERNVIDKTGLTGKYDIDLTWTPENGPAPSVGDNGTTDSTTSIFTALQEQLGLRLQPSKGPVETVVVDHAEQPAEN